VTQGVDISRAGLAARILCRGCDAPLAISSGGVRLCCKSPRGSTVRGGILIHDPQSSAAPPPEMITRDQDAIYYVGHPKFPTQVERLQRFIARHPPSADANTVLDLGCGPGPTTALLLEAGFETVSVDFSVQSLALNARLCGAKASNALFVQADLNNVEFAPATFDGLLMADFLQHLGDKRTQGAFLAKAFRALKPGGWFYLSFFNTSLIDRLARDMTGTRRDIPYWRVPPAEVRGMLPKEVKILNSYFMNLFNDAGLDRIAATLPIARLFARMAVIEGVKESIT